MPAKSQHAERQAFAYHMTRRAEAVARGPVSRWLTRIASRGVAPAASSPDAPERPSPPRAPAGWISVLHDECVALWHRTPAELPRHGDAVAWHRQWRNARATSRLIDDVAARMVACPREAAERQPWRDALRRRILEVAGAHFGWPAGSGKLALGDGFHESAVAFAREARRFDPALPLEHLGQALRNVWIANTLQMLSGLPVRLTASLFAYSMLYPATDNLLDDPRRPAAAKRAFNERLGRWLAGSPAAPADGAETAVRSLVRRIEREFPRTRYAEVWESVVAIHRAQDDSLRQQRSMHLPEAALLALTVAKGGASVLADLALASGGADRHVARFAFRYGVFLQMLDDLQDVSEDLAAGHDTLFTRAARGGPLDALTGRLARFMDLVLDGDGRRCPGADADCLDLIRRNCRALIVGVVAREPHRFSRAFRRRVEREWPVTLRAMRALQQRAVHRVRDARRRLQERRRTPSPLEWLLDGGR